MMRLSEAAAMLGLPFAGEDAEVLRISTDSRTIRPGDLFIALRGEKFDGGRFAAQALGQGAVGVVLDQAQVPDVTVAIRVDDTRLALGKLAAAWRRRPGSAAPRAGPAARPCRTQAGARPRRPWPRGR